MQKRKVKLKPKQKPIPKLKKELQVYFNAYIRARDKMSDSFVCISCGKTLPLEKLQAGHFFTVQSYDHIRYDERNCNGECSACNCFNKNHQIWYAINLKEKIGEDSFNDLLKLAKEKPSKGWTREELENLIEIYKQKRAI